MNRSFANSPRHDSRLIRCDDNCGKDWNFCCLGGFQCVVSKIFKCKNGNETSHMTNRCLVSMKDGQNNSLFTNASTKLQNDVDVVAG